LSLRAQRRSPSAVQNAEGLFLFSFGDKLRRMIQTVAGIETEVVEAEQEKFAVPLVLLHGFWMGPRAWLRASGYLAHRGWRSYVPDLRPCWQVARWSEVVAALERFLSALGTPPVVVGQDFGALLALYLAPVRLAVGIAPLQVGGRAGSLPHFRGVRACLASRFGRAILPARRRIDEILGTADPESIQPLPARWRSELAQLDLRPAARIGVPRLVAVGTGDRCAPQRFLEALAGELGATLVLYPGAPHALLCSPQWAAVLDDVHRWIVQQLDEGFLLLRGDEDLREE